MKIYRYQDSSIWVEKGGKNSNCAHDGIAHYGPYHSFPAAAVAAVNSVGIISLASNAENIPNKHAALVEVSEELFVINFSVSLNAREEGKHY